MIDMATQQPIRNMLTKVKSDMKLILSISGTFWLTIVPGMVIRMILLPSGASWDEADTRSDMTIFIWAKIGWSMDIFLSNLLNPIMYVIHLLDLRRTVSTHLCLD